MSRRAAPKAYEVQMGKFTVILAPDAYYALSDDAEVSAAWEEKTAGLSTAVRRIKGNEKFVLSTKEEIEPFRAALKAKNPAALVRAKKVEAKEAAFAKAYAAKRKIEEAAAAKAYRAKLTALAKERPLPMGLTVDDFIRPAIDEARAGSSDLGRALFGHADYALDHVEIWLVERFGWVIPTLTIRNAPRDRDSNRRTYAVSLSDGKLCRVGLGPHVKQTANVYLTKSNAKRLKPLVDRVVAGSIEANEYRDDLSTRRARRSGLRSRYF